MKNPVIFGLALSVCLGATAQQTSGNKTRSNGTAQETRADKNQAAVSKKTESGFEVFLLTAEATKERDPLDNVLIYRFGSCPPGIVLRNIKLHANRGNDVIIVRLGLGFTQLWQCKPVFAGLG